MSQTQDESGRFAARMPPLIEPSPVTQLLRQGSPAAESSPAQAHAGGVDVPTRYSQLRAVIQHENDLLNHRLSWMWTLQGFLFASVGFAVEKDRVVLLALCVVGFVSCVSIGYALWVGTRFLIVLNDAARPLGQIIDPALCGASSAAAGKAVREFVWLFPWVLLPWFMAAVWIGLACYFVLH